MQRCPAILVLEIDIDAFFQNVAYGIGIAVDDGVHQGVASNSQGPCASRSRGRGVCNTDRPQEPPRHCGHASGEKF